MQQKLHSKQVDAILLWDVKIIGILILRIESDNLTNYTHAPRDSIRYDALRCCNYMSIITIHFNNY